MQIVREDSTPVTAGVVTAHAPIPPSSMSRIIKCQATVYYMMTMPALPPSSRAIQGTRAHSVAEKFVPEVLNQLTDYVPKYPRLSVSNEASYYGERYAEYIANLLMDYIRLPNKYDVSYYVEKKVTYTKDCWGTVDFIAVVTDKTTGLTTLYVVDYKYGSGMHVSAVENWQMLTYALAAKTTLESKGVHIDAYSLHIFQPRYQLEGDECCGRWDISSVEANPYFIVIEEVIAKISNATVEELKAFPCREGEHCHWCTGRGVCATKNSRYLPLVDTASSQLASIPMDVLCHIALNAADIKTFVDYAKEAVIGYLKAGNTIEGIDLVPVPKRRKFKSDVDEVANGLMELGISDPYRTTIELITLTEAEKVLGKGKIDHLLEDTSSSEESYKIVRGSNYIIPTRSTAKSVSSKPSRKDVVTQMLIDSVKK